MDGLKMTEVQRVNVPSVEAKQKLRLAVTITAYPVQEMNFILVPRKTSIAIVALTNWIFITGSGTKNCVIAVLNSFTKYNTRHDKREHENTEKVITPKHMTQQNTFLFERRGKWNE